MSRSLRWKRDRPCPAAAAAAVAAPTAPAAAVAGAERTKENPIFVDADSADFYSQPFCGDNNNNGI